MNADIFFFRMSLPPLPPQLLVLNDATFLKFQGLSEWIICCPPSLFRLIQFGCKSFLHMNIYFHLMTIEKLMRESVHLYGEIVVDIDIFMICYKSKMQKTRTPFTRELCYCAKQIVKINGIRGVHKISFHYYSFLVFFLC